MSQRPLLTLVLASSNQGKLRELRTLLAGLPVDLRTAQSVLGFDLEVEEDGSSFEQNAEKKARAVCKATKMVSLADDSGLEVDALGGAPGVRSARFAGEGADDAANNAKLLGELEARVGATRSARFRCVLALKSPWESRVRLSEGACEGAIADAPRGERGFGYDPLFVPVEMPGRTMAELLPDEKNRISHRSRAARAMLPVLAELVRTAFARTDRVGGGR